MVLGGRPPGRVGHRQGAFVFHHHDQPVIALVVLFFGENIIRPRLAVVSLWTEDRAATAHFYRDVIGLRLIDHRGDRPHFDLDGVYPVVILQGRPLPPREPALARSPIVAFAVDDLDAAVEQLHLHQIELPWGIEEDVGSRWMMLHDPAGNLIALASFNELWQTNALVLAPLSGNITVEGVPMPKKPFDIDQVIRLLRLAVDPWPKAAMFELAEEGFTSPFEQLVACIISIRTYDEVMLTTARRFFAHARTPLEVSQLTPAGIGELIAASSFSERKAQQIHAIARRVVEEYGGIVPCDLEILLSFAGVGPKCANLVLGIACDEPHIGVDVHVHRVTNRWGYVQTATPERTMMALEAKLPQRYWVEINRLLVPFGKHICTGQRPHCSTCPVLDMCQQVGV